MKAANRFRRKERKDAENAKVFVCALRVFASFALRAVSLGGRA
jgi:predicted nucleic acid-binding protein